MPTSFHANAFTFIYTKHWILILYLRSFAQVKSNLEKAKQALEKETSDLTIEVRSLSQAKQDGDNKRKKLEGQVTELQSRFTDSEKQKAELGERCAKITVNDFQQLLYISFAHTKAFIFKCQQTVVTKLPETSLSWCRLSWRV